MGHWTISWSLEPIHVDDPWDAPTYCDLYDCEDCPRYGEDCDGRERMKWTVYRVGVDLGDRWIYREVNDRGEMLAIVADLSDRFNKISIKVTEHIRLEEE